MERRIAFITGASSGIGEACARLFAKNGYDVILNGRDAERLNSVAASVCSLGAEACVLCFDVRNRPETLAALAGLTPRWRTVDVLINSAGGAWGLEKVQEGDIDDWDTMLDTNVRALLFITRQLVPAMIRRGRGHIINIGSVAGEAAYAGGAVYCACKAAVQMLTDGLRIDLVDTAVKVTNVKPGLVETRFSVTRFHGDEARAAQVYKGIKPLTADDIADVAWFAAAAPAHVQIADVLVLPVHQANVSTVFRG